MWSPDSRNHETRKPERIRRLRENLEPLRPFRCSGYRELEAQGAWESSHARVPKPRNVKGGLVWNREEHRKLSACIGFLKAYARGQRDLWICSKGSNRSSKRYFSSEEERSRDHMINYTTKCMK
jgi:hypothetical protein